MGRTSEMAENDDEKTKPKPQVLAVELHENVSVFMEAHARTRAGFSLPNLRAAEHFADQLLNHEEAHNGEVFGPHWDHSQWYASAAILLSFSAMEAALDETEDDLKIPEPLLVPFQRAPFWDRVGAVLAYVEGEQFERGSEPFQSADLLRALRNGVAHPKAEWFDERTTHKTLTDRVNGARLPLSPFMPDPDKAFPLGCMSAGVAAWAAQSARAFIGDFRERCGLERRA